MFTVFGEVTNLNNSNYSTHGRFSDQPLDTWNYGRRYTAGVRFKFGAAPAAPPPPTVLPPPPPEVPPPPPPPPVEAPPPPQPAAQPTGERG